MAADWKEKKGKKNQHHSMFFKVVLQERELYGRASQAWKTDLKFKSGSPKK